MKKLFLTFFFLFTCLICLFSCDNCKHSWELKDCEIGKICSLCGKVNEDEQLSHKWQEASCLLPKTCLNCAKTEGEAQGHRWSAEKCMSAQKCRRCDATKEVLQHDWIDATCDIAKHCSRCKEQEGVALGHSWTVATCTSPKACINCGLKEAEALGHNWIFVSCTSPRYCYICNQQEPSAPGHQFVNASCTSPSRCDVCKTIVSGALGHSWIDASCDSPKYCSRCSITDGKALGHNWQLTEAVKPSCGYGKNVSVCTLCNKINEEIIQPTILFHICNESGTCTVCNTAFNPSEMRLVSIVLDSNFVLREGAFKSTETTSTIYKPITPQDVGIPIVDLNADISGVNKNNPITIPFAYDDGTLSVESKIEIKLQGASSTGYPKKNYSIKLVNDAGEKNKVKILDEWGKQHKYCLKANYVDFSQSRNVVSAKIFGDIIRSRSEEDHLTNLPNGGAIDGFPVLVYNNGEFLGLYTFNIPKDKWMFGMKDSDEKTQAIVMGEHWGDSVAFRTPISYNSSNKYWTGSSNWELEYASNEDSLVDNSTVWVAESLNRLIEFVINNDGQAFVDGIEEYIDIDKCIDSMIYTFVICADDNISKNILWVTLDGKKWFSSVYDMDGTWGMQWNGSFSFNENTRPISDLDLNTDTRYNLLWVKLYKYYYERIVERYIALRQGALSLENITNQFESYFDLIPEVAYTADKTKWTGIPNRNADHLNQILSFAKMRLEAMDRILVTNKE